MKKKIWTADEQIDTARCRVACQRLKMIPKPIPPPDDDETADVVCWMCVDVVVVLDVV